MSVELVDGGDGQAFRWGADGRLNSFTDDPSSEDAFRKAVAEGMARGELLEDETEREIGRELALRVGISKAAGDASSLWVGWYLPPDIAAKLALGDHVPGAIAAADLHLTVLYLGDAERYDTELVAALVKVFCSTGAPCWLDVDGCISGTGRFVGPDDTDVYFATVDIPALGHLRHSLKESLAAGCVYDIAPEHGFVPHVTLGYLPKGTATPAHLPETLPLDLDSLTISATTADGKQSATFSFPEPPGEAAMDQPPPLSSAYYASREIRKAVANVAALLRSDTDEVAKAGRVVSAANLSLLQDAVEAMSKVISAETARRILELAPEEDATKSFDLEYTVAKSADEQRYTFGPLYAPGKLDAHKEWTTADDLQKAAQDYVQSCIDSGSNRINLQHDDSGDATVGRWVDCVSWPYETTVKMAVPGEADRELVMPANTVYMGIIWDAGSWDAVKSKKLTGLSLGGKAVRVSQASGAPSEHMGDKLAALKQAEEATAADEAARAETLRLAAVGTLAEKAARTVENDKDRTLLERMTAQLTDAFKAMAGKEQPAPVVHVHMPTIEAPIVNINEAPLDPDPEGE